MSAPSRSPGAAEPLVYALSGEAVRLRARNMALWSAVSMLMPPMLVMVLLAQMRLAPVRAVVPIAALVFALAVTRAVFVFRSASRRLRALEAQIAGDTLTLRTARDAVRIARADVERILDVGGPLGGFRLDVREHADGPARIDLPRGGARFGDLRAALSEWRPIDRAPRRSPITRIVFALLVVLGIFFLPFFVDDVSRSRLVACAIVLAFWIAMRVAIARS